VKDERKKLDQEIKDALEGFEVPYDGSSWDMLASKMEGEPGLFEDNENDQAFDAEIKHKLRNNNPAYNPAHWRLMAEKIKQEFSLQEKLIRYKIAEIAVMLLVLLTLYQYQPLNEGIKNKLIPGIERMLNVNEATEKAQTVEKRNSIRAPKDNKNQGSGNSGAVFSNIDPRSGFKKNGGLALTDKEEEFISNPYKSTFGYNRLPLELKQKNAPSLNSKTSLQEKEVLRQTANMASLERRIDDIQLIDFQEESNILGVSPINNPQSNSRLRVSMFSASEYNYIKTPYDPIYPLEEYSRYAPGYGGGITLGMSFGKWEVETGGIYASKEYEPRVPDEVIGGLLTTGLVTLSFENIQLNMLEVPLNVRYNFGQLQKWRFYGQTGASLHLAMQAHYDKFPNNLYSGFARQAIDNTSLGQKKFPDGLLEGGNFEENSYFTANLGLGVERLLSTRWSLFLQPSVQAYLLPGYNNGLGPNLDRISTFSILTGARVTLW
jgi:hypothetical protein